VSDSLWRWHLLTAAVDCRCQHTSSTHAAASRNSRCSMWECAAVHNAVCSMCGGCAAVDCLFACTTCMHCMTLTKGDGRTHTQHSQRLQVAYLGSDCATVACCNCESCHQNQDLILHSRVVASNNTTCCFTKLCALHTMTVPLWLHLEVIS
jgi:hypothetical protein